MPRPQLRATPHPDDLRHAAYARAPVTRRRALRAQVQADCVDRPGVYRMLGATGLVLYVGKAKRLRTRLLSYFRAATKNRRRDKQARILRHAHALEWEYAHSEFAALLRELRLIKQHRPRFNVLMNVDEAPRGWLAITNDAVPALRVLQRTDAPEAAVLYGPFRRLAMLTEATRALADATGVRDCTLPPTQLARVTPLVPRARRGARADPRADARTMPDETPRVPGCLRAEIGSCPAPCTAPRTRTWDGAADYAARVDRARDFLAGRSAAPVATLRGAMHAAADAWHFERAGSLKARLEALEWLESRLQRFHAGADRLSFVLSRARPRRQRALVPRAPGHRARGARAAAGRRRNRGVRGRGAARLRDSRRHGRRHSHARSRRVLPRRELVPPAPRGAGARSTGHPGRRVARARPPFLPTSRSMRRSLVLAVASSLAAPTLVAVPRAQAQAPQKVTKSVPAASRGTAATETAAFVGRLGADTTSAERWTRTLAPSGGRLEGDLFNRAPVARVTHYVVDLDARGNPTRAEVRTRRPDGTPLPNTALGAVYTFRDDSAFAEVQMADSVARFRVPAPAGTVPSLAGSYALWEAGLRPQRGAGRDTASIVLWGAGAPRVQTLKARAAGGDAMEVDYAGSPMVLRFAPDGRLLSVDGSRTTNKIVVDRLADANVAAIAQGFGSRPAMGQASPRDTVRATVGAAELLVDYGRPFKRGRTVWGGLLVPPGQIWRTGANAATQLRTSTDLVDRRAAGAGRDVHALHDADGRRLPARRQQAGRAVGHGVQAGDGPRARAADGDDAGVARRAVHDRDRAGGRGRRLAAAAVGHRRSSRCRSRCGERPHAQPVTDATCSTALPAAIAAAIAAATRSGDVRSRPSSHHRATSIGRPSISAASSRSQT